MTVSASKSKRLKTSRLKIGALGSSRSMVTLSTEEMVVRLHEMQYDTSDLHPETIRAMRLMLHWWKTACLAEHKVWTSCSERLPDMTLEVVGWNRRTNREEIVYRFVRNDGERWQTRGITSRDLDEISHWRTIIPPPLEADEVL